LWTDEDNINGALWKEKGVVDVGVDVDAVEDEVEDGEDRVEDEVFPKGFDAVEDVEAAEVCPRFGNDMVVKGFGVTVKRDDVESIGV
jgi:hypothetical protein